MSRQFNRILLAAFLISFVIGFLINKNTTRTVELRNSGFFPGELRISKGSEVTFLNKTSKTFWPASNPHPIHDIYSEFDAREPISPGKAWTFRFDENGIFNYHDHLFPTYKGTIIVGSDISVTPSKHSCLNKNSKDQRTCWQNLLEETLRKKGLDEGFRLFRELAQIAPSDCHQYAHDLGGFAFKEYITGKKKMQAGLETSYCGYGFWHGFMGEMLASTTFERTLLYCESGISAVPELSIRVKENCYHGIGIGLIPDPPEAQFWGKTQPLVTKALESCDKIKTVNLRGFCYSGAFHAVVNYMMDEKYKFSIDTTDPFALCFSQKEQYQKDCYFQIAPQLSGLTDHDLPDTLRLVKKIPAPYYENTAMLAMINFTNQNNSQEEYLNFVSSCQKIDNYISHLCIPAVVASIFNSGEPDQEYRKAVTLCSSNVLSGNDKVTCFGRILRSSKEIYPLAKVKTVCAAFEKDYQYLCT